MDGKELVLKLDEMKPKFANALPSYCGFNQEHVIRTVLTEVQKSKNLMRCTFNSIAQAALEACSLGLLPNSVQGLAYLVPYGDKCQLIPGYKGLIKLALQSPHVNSINANCVYSTDKLEVEFGLTPKLTHVPNLMNPEKGEFIGAYAVANMAQGDPVFEYLPKWRIDEIKAKSKAGRGGPWVSDYESMAKKTAIKSLMKVLPLEMDKIELAALKAEDGSAGFEYDIDADAWEYIDGDEQDSPQTKKLNQKFLEGSSKSKSKNQKDQKTESEKTENTVPLIEAEGEDGEVASNLSGLQLATKQLEARAKDKEGLKAFYQLNESKWAKELGPDDSNELGELYDQLINS